jgi:hypothetical protein
MNTLQANHPGRTASGVSIIGFHGGVHRRAGDLRAVTLENRIANTDSIFGAANSLQGWFEESFGKTANDIEMDADKEMDEFSDRIQRAFSRV